jgi:hypothetical protein
MYCTIERANCANNFSCYQSVISCISFRRADIDKKIGIVRRLSWVSRILCLSSRLPRDASVWLSSGSPDEPTQGGNEEQTTDEASDETGAYSQCGAGRAGRHAGFRSHCANT